MATTISSSMTVTPPSSALTTKALQSNLTLVSSHSSSKMATPASTQKPVQRKKKAARACIHCQKAHLTCDDSRPCQRCIKRDLASTCTDGARKKAKYLQDVQVVDPSPSTRFPSQMNMSSGTSVSSVPDNLGASLIRQGSFRNDNLVGTNTLLDINNYNYGFGSSAANLEYSILSSMLGSSAMDTFLDTTSHPQTSLADSESPAGLSEINLWSTTQHSGITATESAHPTMHTIPTPPQPHIPLLSAGATPSADNNSISSATPPSQLQSTETAHTASTPATTYNATPSSAIHDPLLFSSDQSPHQQQQPNAIGSIPSGTVGGLQSTSSTIASLPAYGESNTNAKGESPAAPSAVTGPKKRGGLSMTPQMAYASVNKPFSYAEGYHYLINYVKERMSREDLMRISRALALFRPSVLASMMNLTVDDLIFTERCIQRTLLEYEKLIGYSGTPTVIWRRTGEIALVGKEFSLLTQWSRDALMSQKTYIYELMSNSSAVEYWEKYAMHAFDNTDSAVYSSCILLSPTKRVVPCTFCFTIKRDIFDLPSIIVGNFLPILS